MSFEAGLELSRRFYLEAVKPIVDRAAPGIGYAAALLGPGSEVLGYDTEESTDHHWGPRLLLFFREDELGRVADRLDAALREELPISFGGYPTNFAPPDAIGVRLLLPVETRPVDHRVELVSVRSFMREIVGFDPLEGIGLLQWLTTPHQALLSATAGAVYHDELGELAAARGALAFYPRDLWLYLMAVQWSRIGEVEAFVGRCGSVGDDLGARLLTGRIVREVMALSFLIARRYAPYAKWAGTAFASLPGAERLVPPLQAALAADTPATREAALVEAYRIVAERHNELGVTEPLSTDVTRFHGRPYLVLPAERFAEALRGAIRVEAVKRLPPSLGSIDQLVASDDLPELLKAPAIAAGIAGLYEEALA